jgi:iron complex outermembrane receptor protein
VNNVCIARWHTAIAAVVYLVLATAGAGSLLAQSTGTIQGSVTDSRGQAIVGASVAVSGVSQGVTRRTSTDNEGKFKLGALASGTYTLQVAASGFSTVSNRTVTLTSGTTQSLSFTLNVASVTEEVMVEAELDDSVAAQLSPVKAVLDAGSARTEITSQYIREFTSPVTDFSDITQAAPGTVSWSPNGIGMGQAKTYYRGFADGNYTMTWDGVPFSDSNDPTHHSWAYVPAPAISYVDFDRSPGTASDVGQANFGGSIHMLSPKLGDTMMIKGAESFGSFNTQQILGDFNSGLFGGANPKSNLWFEGHHMTSDGYQTGNYQVRTAGTAKYTYKKSDNTNLSLIGTVVIVDSNTPNNDATRAQLAANGDNYLLEHSQYNANGSLNALWYRYYTYHVPTNFEIFTWTSDLGHGWKLDVKPYTYSYSNHQHYQNDQSSTTATVNATSGINKLNQYNRIGDIATASSASRYGVLRFGAWYEYTTTHRYQIQSDPRTWVDAPLIKNIKFHESFITNSVQPFAEYQLVAIPRWTITAGLKDAYYNMSLTQYADGKTVGPLGCPAGSTPASCPNSTKHDAGYNSWLPSIEANYRIKNNWSVYGQYGRGSVIPPSSVFDVTNALVAVTPKPIVASTWQGGTVVKLNRLSFDADGYHIHYQNSYSSFTPSTGPDAGQTFYYANPPSNTVGFEAEGNLALFHGLSLFANGTVGQAKYEAGVAKPATPTTPAIRATPEAWVANTPHDTENAGLTYQGKHLDLGFFNKRIGTRWGDNGSVHQAVPLDPFSMTNLFFNYTLRNGSRFDQSRFKLSVNNLFDNHDAVLISPATPATSTVLFAPNALDTIQLLPGRSIMVTFQIGFAPER